MNIERLERQKSLAITSKPAPDGECGCDNASCSMDIELQIVDLQNACSSGIKRIGALEVFQDLAEFPEGFEWDYDPVLDPILNEYDLWEAEYGPDCYEEETPDNGYDD